MDDIEKALLESPRLIAYGRQLLKQSEKMVRQSRNCIQQSRAAILNPHSPAAAPNAALSENCQKIARLPATGLIGTESLVISTIQTPSSSLDGPTR